MIALSNAAIIMFLFYRYIHIEIIEVPGENVF
jgi:hypothetical protein